MRALHLSPCIVTDKVAESRDFYVKHFQARVAFDCGWYVSVEIGGPEAGMQFMSPQVPGQQRFSGVGLTYNFQVESADVVHERLTSAGLAEAMPLDDHPWGDRGFSIIDPNGIQVYIYHETEPDEEFKGYFK